jgi:branched-subunit amino acid aminotransferase/4-amino-4-deoxychorismate lyase
MSLIWLNGVLVSRDAARIDPDDRGFLLGDGAFETLRLEAGAVRRWSRHQSRLAGALDALEILSPDWEVLEAGIRDLIGAMKLDAAVVRLTVSRGPLGGGMMAQEGGTPTVLMTARPLPERVTSVSAQIIETARRDARNLSSRHKLTGYADMLGARRSAQRAGADMALVLSSDGPVSSADSANLFWVKEGVVFTPSLACGPLPGTTRAALIEALRMRGVRVEEGAYDASALKSADWIFVTNAVMGLTPISTLDGRALSVPGADLALFRAICEDAL